RLRSPILLSMRGGRFVQTGLGRWLQSALHTPCPDHAYRWPVSETRSDAVRSGNPSEPLQVLLQALWPDGSRSSSLPDSAAVLPALAHRKTCAFPRAFGNKQGDRGIPRDSNEMELSTGSGSIRTVS